MVMSDTHEPLHKQLKAAREAKKMSLRKLGELSGVPFVTIHQAEQSDGNPTLKTLVAIAKSLGITLVIS